MLLLSFAVFFFKLNFSQNSFRNTIIVSNSLDPGQDRHSVGPDLRPNCLHMLSVSTSKERVNSTYQRQLFSSACKQFRPD